MMLKVSQREQKVKQQISHHMWRQEHTHTCGREKPVQLPCWSQLVTSEVTATRPRVLICFGPTLAVRTLWASAVMRSKTSLGSLTQSVIPVHVFHLLIDYVVRISSLR